MRKHSKGCICLACCAARLASPKAPDPLQGSIFEPGKNDSPRSSWQVEGNPGSGTDWVKERFLAGDAVVATATDCKSAARGLGGSSPPIGIERKEAVLTAHDQRRRGTLLWLRAELQKLYFNRLHEVDHMSHCPTFVTADDARRLLKTHPERDPGPPYAFLGALFKNREEWEWTGKLVESVYGQNNGRQQRAWRFIGK